MDMVNLQPNNNYYVLNFIYIIRFFLFFYVVFFNMDFKNLGIFPDGGEDILNGLSILSEIFWEYSICYLKCNERRIFL